MKCIEDYQLLFPGLNKAKSTPEGGTCKNDKKVMIPMLLDQCPLPSSLQISLPLVKFDLPITSI
jgi:hypothetical protein